MNEGIKVEVKYTDGYEKRFTEACIDQISKRSKRSQIEADQGDNQEGKTA